MDNLKVKLGDTLSIHWMKIGRGWWVFDVFKWTTTTTWLEQQGSIKGWSLQNTFEGVDRSWCWCSCSWKRLQNHPRRIRTPQVQSVRQMVFNYEGWQSKIIPTANHVTVIKVTKEQSQASLSLSWLMFVLMTPPSGERRTAIVCMERLQGQSAALQKNVRSLLKITWTNHSAALTIFCEQVRLK